MLPFSSRPYRHLMPRSAIAPTAAERAHNRDWDKGALLIIAIIAIPTAIASGVAIVLAM